MEMTQLEPSEMRHIDHAYSVNSPKWFEIEDAWLFRFYHRTGRVQIGGFVPRHSVSAEDLFQVVSSNNQISKKMSGTYDCPANFLVVDS